MFCKEVPKISFSDNGTNLVAYKKAFLHKNKIDTHAKTLDDYHTIITEIEHIINCRLITYTSEDIESQPALQPVDFLNINMSNFLPFEGEEDEI